MSLKLLPHLHSLKPANISYSTASKNQVVFLGTPHVSTIVLDTLFNASAAPSSCFKVAAIVTQPTAQRGRHRAILPSPVAEHALVRGFPSKLIFTPDKAQEGEFLFSLRALQPQLCITAAYGNILPSEFLSIPSMGTVNIHPSLLPLYRGAAPVQRALQNGVKETGVSLAFTVRSVDSGPIIASEKLIVDNQIKAPELLELLFSKGSKLLTDELPSIFNGSALRRAQPQDHSKATYAPKLAPEESWLSFDQDALTLHNKVRAFAGWPGTRAQLAIMCKDGKHDIIELKIISTTVSCHGIPESHGADEVTFNGSALLFPCAYSTVLEVLEVQRPGKKVLSAPEFWHGIRGESLRLWTRGPLQCKSGF